MEKKEGLSLADALIDGLGAIAQAIERLAVAIERFPVMEASGDGLLKEDNRRLD